MTLLKYLGAALGLIAFASCEKNTFGATDRSTPTGVAFVKIAYFSAYTAPYNVQVSFNGERLTNVLSMSASPYATSFPGSGMNMTGSTATSDYLALTPGPNKTELISYLAGTGNPLFKVYETTKTFESDRRQTLYISDTAANTISWVMNDDTATPDSGKYKLRFVNAMANLPAADLYQGPNNGVATLLKSDVKFGSGTDFFEMPVVGTDSFFVRPTGAAASTAPIIRRGFPLGSQRVFTLVVRGYNGQASTATRAPHLSVIVNQ